MKQKIMMSERTSRMSNKYALTVRLVDYWLMSTTSDLLNKCNQEDGSGKPGEPICMRTEPYINMEYQFTAEDDEDAERQAKATVDTIKNDSWMDGDTDRNRYVIRRATLVHSDGKQVVISEPPQFGEMRHCVQVDTQPNSQ